MLPGSVMRASLDASDPLAARDERGGELDLGALARALWARRRLILIPTLIALVCSAIVVQLIPAKYKSTASVFLQAQESTFTRPTGAQPGADQQVVDEQAVASQVQVIMSRDLALAAIKKLGLVGNPEFDPGASGVGPLSQVLMVLGLAKDPLAKAPEERVLDTYFEALAAYPVDKSRVITIEFSSRDPDLAARAANTIAALYIETQRAAKRGESLDASQALSPQIDELRKTVAKAEAAVEDYRTKNGLFIAQNNASLTTQQLVDANTQLSAARAQQTEAQAKASLIRGLLKAGKPIDVSDVNNNDLMRRLIEQRVTLSSQLALESRTLLPAHPRIKELNAQLAGLQKQIVIEAQKTVRSLENDAQLAGSRVETLTQQLDSQKQQAASSNEQEVQLRALEREAKAQRDLLEAYLSRYREANAYGSFTEMPAGGRIISQAVPATTPYFPRKLPIIFIVTVAVLVLSLALVAASELMSGRAFTQRPASEPPAEAERPPLRPAPVPAESPREPPPAGPGRHLPPEPAAEAAVPAPLWTPPMPAAAGEAALGLHEPLGYRPPEPAGDPVAAVLPADAPAPVATTPEPAAAEAESSQSLEAIAAPVEPVPAAEPAPPVEPLPMAEVPPVHDATPQRDRLTELERLAAQLRARMGGTRSVLFAGSGSREGISAAASHFARALAAASLRVVLIDLTPGEASGGRPGLGELLAGEASFVDVIERDRFSRLHLIGGGRAVSADADGEGVTARLQVVFEALSSTYDAVVFDGGVLRGPEGPIWAPIAAACESALVVSVPEEAGADGIDARGVLERLGARDIATVAAPEAGPDGLAAA